MLSRVDDGPGSDQRPRKAPDLEVNEVVDGYVVYQPAFDRVHYLNRTAVIVLELCTGENDADAIAAAVQEAFELPDPPAAEISACLAQLQREQLVV
jgi:hypothetical protein